MKEGPITDPERRQELEQSLRRSLGSYRNIQELAKQAMVEAVRLGDEQEAQHQAQRAQDWLRQALATEESLDLLRRTGIYRITLPANVKLGVEE